MRQLFSMALLVILVSNSSYANENNVVTHRDTGIGISINANGNVGIGKRPALSKLDVNGSINASGSITTSGSVGIGTTSPNTLLEVKGGATGRQLQLTGTNGGIGMIFVDAANAGFYNWQVASQHYVADALTIVPSSAPNGTTFSNPAFTLLRTGNLGIGTSTPKSYSNIRYLSLDGVGGSAVTFYRNGTENGEIHNSNGGGLTYTNSYGHYFTGSNVGIGTTTPNTLLEVKGGATGRQLQLTGTNGGIGMLFVDAANAGFYNWQIASQYYVADGLTIVPSSSPNSTTFSQPVVTILRTGNFGIGTTNPTEKLTVNGTIKAKEVSVVPSGWSDYVFDKEYQLRSLFSLEQFIQQNKHLPDVPSAEEVEKKGIKVGDTQALLLKKIEELTLYIIEQNKESQQQKEKILALEKVLLKQNN